jgi:hypothetical protein
MYLPENFACYDISMDFPLVLNLFLLFLIGLFWLLSFFILYHLVRFGVGTFPKRLGLLFLGGAVILSSIVFLSYASLDLTTLLP